MAEKKDKSQVHQDSIHVETIKKEHRLQKLHTEFSINPYRTLHILPDKPMSRRPPESIVEECEFIKAFHKARQLPAQKYSAPLTESHEIGWYSTPLVPCNRDDERLNFFRRSTDVTRYQEMVLRK
ncbi:unnamed protein product [Ophioblennius macclurei]